MLLQESQWLRTADIGRTQISSLCPGSDREELDFPGREAQRTSGISSLLGAACGGLPFSEGSECGEAGVWGKGLPDCLTPCQPPGGVFCM